MNTIQQALLECAASLRARDLTPEDIAVQTLVKQAGLSEPEARQLVARDQLEKSACAALAAKGVDHEQAARMVKAAKLDISDLVSTPTQKSNPLAEILEKTAQHLDALEQRLAFLEDENDTLDQLQKQASVDAMTLPGPIDNLRKEGAFTKEDLLQLQTMEPVLLNKIASASTGQDWGMGSASGKMDVSTTDSFTRFLLA